MFEAPEQLIPDNEIETVHANARFGDQSKRDVVRESVLKVASGFHIGYTAQTIVFEHGLVNTITKRPKLTEKGRKYLWASFKKHACADEKLKPAEPFIQA